ncbi:MAG: serine hydrolase [Planctomycetota bacterium]
MNYGYRLLTVFCSLSLLGLAGYAQGQAQAPAAVKGQAPPGLTDAIDAVDQGQVPAQHALLVYQRGQLLLERYWDGEDHIIGQPIPAPRSFGPETLHDLRSCSKSVVGLLTGIAIDEGLLPPIETSAHLLFPDLIESSPERFTAAHRRITLEHLLDMTDGIAWDQDNAKPMMARNEFWLWQAQDPSAYVWSQPIAHPAGETFNYSSGSTTLLAEAIRRRSGMDIEAYAKEKLFRPLGVTRWEWVAQRNGSPAAFGGLRLAPRDMLKLGRLVLQRGKWEGKQVVPGAWIDATGDRRGEQRFYGYQWWLDTYTVHGQSVHAVAAGGLGGQYIHVFPTLDAVVVSTAGHYRDAHAATQGMRLLEKWVLPALMPSPPSQP